MKLLSSLVASLFLLVSSQSAFAQQSTPKLKGGATTEQVQFKTSAVCDMCKARLEKSMAYEKGVQAANLDVPSKVLTVTYRPEKTTPAALRTAVQRTGYDADELTADTRAYNKLPDCCKKTNSVHTDSKH
ncbi:heavy-metal-associated domain-containing protein [Hymenobacter taeanensis]|uniref:Heavy-metal-associated domain-containing protein n=1 Tax=Hymenobacter taeanensis TaxID=2735321 RepID=A0A6M6BIL4_9BACT|nr:MULTISPECIES: heavy metal-associated domain-containing protein [Hymenobacter]QJX47870.1 heavy-metal-associated domain-containing protein [Hymenobacter taeanensis]UOQ82689.1 heavy-metal-associated domain-containing protein [Hymenobacter sp. 5414T-23]